MNKKNNVLRVLVVSLGVLIAPWLIHRLPDLTYTLPIFGGLLVGAVVYFVLLYLCSGLSREYLRKNSRWIWTPFILVALLLVISFMFSHFQIKLQKESILAYYVFAGLGVALNIWLNVKHIFPPLTRYKKSKKKSRTIADDDDDDDDDDE